MVNLERNGHIGNNQNGYPGNGAIPSQPTPISATGGRGFQPQKLKEMPKEFGEQRRVFDDYLKKLSERTTAHISGDALSGAKKKGIGVNISASKPDEKEKQPK